MRVKICGLMRVEDAEAAIRAGADFLGFIFVPGTPRAIDPKRMRWIADIEGAETVGVFRDAPPERIVEIREALKLDRIQLHGGESDDLLDRLGQGTIRRVPVPADGVDRSRVETLIERGALPLIDPGAGDGLSCDWEALADRLDDLEFGLAGGLSPVNVARAVRIVRPFLVDVSSGVELRPGVKDHDALRAFVDAAREAAG